VSSGRGLFGDTDLEGDLGDVGGDEMAEKGLGSIGRTDSLRITEFIFGFGGKTGFFPFAGGTLIGILLCWRSHSISVEIE
jgi:hypothetical protein